MKFVYMITLVNNPCLKTGTAKLWVLTKDDNYLDDKYQDGYYYDWIETEKIFGELAKDYFKKYANIVVFNNRSNAEDFIKKCGFEHSQSYGISLEDLEGITIKEVK